jgi:hypothetical protein
MTLEQTDLGERINELKTQIALKSVVLTFRSRQWFSEQAKKWMP